MEEDSHQCQPDCDCCWCASLLATYCPAYAHCEYAQQRGKHDWTYGNVAGWHGYCRSPSQKSLLHSTKLFARCTSSDCSSYHCSAATLRVPRI